MEAAIKKLPKVELHAHLNGCIRESTLFDLAKERSVTLNEQHFHHDHDQAPSNTTSSDSPMFFNVRPRSLQDCFDIFAEIPKCVDDLISLRRITLEALEDFAKHNVVYLELRSTPKQLYFQSAKTGTLGGDGSEQENSIPKLASKKDYCHVILQAMEDFEKQQNQDHQMQEEHIANGSNETSSQPRLPMSCRFIVAVDRSHPKETAIEHITLAKDLVRSDGYGDRVVGVDIGGNPTKVSRILKVEG